jgi:hypothetical protein
MAELKEFKLPDVGEGLTEADIVAWHVQPGDRVEVNQIIVEIETAKAVVELPSPWDGTVARLLALLFDGASQWSGTFASRCGARFNVPRKLYPFADSPLRWRRLHGGAQ